NRRIIRSKCASDCAILKESTLRDSRARRICTPNARGQAQCAPASRTVSSLIVLRGFQNAAGLVGIRSRLLQRRVPLHKVWSSQSRATRTAGTPLQEQMLQDG